MVCRKIRYFTIINYTFLSIIINNFIIKILFARKLSVKISVICGFTLYLWFYFISVNGYNNSNFEQEVRARSPRCFTILTVKDIICNSVESCRYPQLRREDGADSSYFPDCFLQGRIRTKPKNSRYFRKMYSIFHFWNY